MARRISGLVRLRKQGEPVPSAAGPVVAVIPKIKRFLSAGPHGEYPSAMAELWYFSQTRWTNLFEQHGFQVIETKASRILYTGYGVFPWFSMNTRRVLARVLGSATRIYILRKTV